VRRLVPDDTAVGGHVSGGLDCTAVTCRGNQVLAESGRSLVAGYSWAPDERVVPRCEGDERTLLDDVAAQESLAVRRVLRDESGDWFAELDRDRYPPTTHNQERFVLAQAKADGVGVMLSGWGGDELASFNGRAVLHHLARQGNVRAVWNQTSRRVKLKAIRPVGLVPQLRSFAATLFEASPDRVQDLRRRHDARERDAHEAETDAVLRAVSDLAADTRRARLKSFQQARDHHEYQLALLADGHLQRRCDGWYQTGRLFDVFYRYPLLDLDVVNAALQLPWWAFCSHGWTRTAFRLAVEPWVPASVAWNISKTEPALFAPPESENVGNAPVTSVTFRPDDERYQRMLEVARRAGGLGMGGVRAPAPVRARPDAAPRLGT
jgi:asparagine synthase (glutamine-hydrolysing)